MTKLKAVGGCSSHHLQGSGAYCGGRTACYFWHSLHYSGSFLLALALACDPC